MGRGVPQSDERAVELYKLSEAQGDASATVCLGLCYANGLGVDQSYAEARRLYELATVRSGADVALFRNAAEHLHNLNDEIQQHCPLLGQRVVLRGLNTATLNGTRDTAVDFDFSERGWTERVAASGRYTVRLDGPEGLQERLVKVRAANVE